MKREYETKRNEWTSVSVCLLSDDWWYLISFSLLSTIALKALKKVAHTHIQQSVHLILFRADSFLTFPFFRFDLLYFAVNPLHIPFIVCFFFCLASFLCVFSFSFFSSLSCAQPIFIPLLHMPFSQMRMPYLNFAPLNRYRDDVKIYFICSTDLSMCFHVLLSLSFTISYIYVGIDTRDCNHFVVWSSYTFHL